MFILRALHAILGDSEPTVGSLKAYETYLQQTLLHLKLWPCTQTSFWQTLSWSSLDWPQMHFLWLQASVWLVFHFWVQPWCFLNYLGVFWHYTLSYAWPQAVWPCPYSSDRRESKLQFFFFLFYLRQKWCYKHIKEFVLKLNVSSLIFV